MVVQDSSLHADAMEWTEAFSDMSEQRHPPRQTALCKRQWQRTSRLATATPHPLWSLCVHRVLPQLFDQDPEGFLDALMANQDVRLALEYRMLARTHPTPQLADSDTVQIVRGYVVWGRFGSGQPYHDPVVEFETVSVGELPYRIRAVFKAEFMSAVSKYATHPSDSGATWDTQDNVLTFSDLYVDDLPDWVVNRYHEALDAENCDNESHMDEDVDPFDECNVQQETVEYDAMLRAVGRGDEVDAALEIEYKTMIENFITNYDKGNPRFLSYIKSKVQPGQECLSFDRVYQRKARVRLTLVDNVQTEDDPDKTARPPKNW